MPETIIQQVERKALEQIFGKEKGDILADLVEKDLIKAAHALVKRDWETLFSLMPDAKTSLSEYLKGEEVQLASTITDLATSVTRQVPPPPPPPGDAPSAGKPHW